MSHFLFNLFHRHARLLFVFFLIVGAAVIAVIADTPYARLYLAGREIRSIKNVAYIADGNPKHRLNLYLPKAGADFPVVVFVHGGFWQSGDRNYYQSLTGLYGNVGAALAKRGIGVAVISYRLRGEVAIEEQIKDVAEAFAWTHKNIGEHGGDSQRIFLMGHSAGGHLVSIISEAISEAAADALPTGRQAAGTSSPIKGVIASSAIFDLKDMASQSEGPFNEAVTFPHFGPTDADLERWSPISQVQPNLPPFLIMTAENDMSFINPQADAMTEKLRAAGVPVERVTFKGLTHATMMLRMNEASDPVADAVSAFISTH